MKRKIYYFLLDFFEDGTRAVQTSIAYPSTGILPRKARRAYVRSNSLIWDEVEDAVRNLAKEVPFEKNFPEFLGPVKYRFAVPVKELQKAGDEESIDNIWKVAELLLGAEAVDKAAIAVYKRAELSERNEKADQALRDFLDEE